MALKLITASLGPLTVRVVDDDAGAGAPDLAVVLCHGYGAPGHDLVGLAPEVVDDTPALAGRVRFVFPEAPLAMAPGMGGGRMWWPIDMERVQRAMATGEARLMADETPDGMPQARKQLKQTLEALATSTKLSPSQIVVGGFSQGAMLATDVVLRADEAPAALAVLSGALVSEAEWTRLAPRRGGLKVLQSHGRHDPILPFAGAVLLRDLLLQASLDVEFVAFDGGHGLDGDVVERLAALIAGKLG
jgi:phospholipase/carboxylesterase